MLKRGLPEDNRLKSVTVMALNCKPPKMDVSSSDFPCWFKYANEIKTFVVILFPIFLQNNSHWSNFRANVCYWTSLLIFCNLTVKFG